MKLRSSEYTRFLFLGLLVIVVIRHFYNPLQLPTETFVLLDMNNNKVVEMDWEAIYTMHFGNTTRNLLQIICPVISAFFELYRYISGIMIDQGAALMIATEIMIIGYVIFTYYLERFHTFWHNKEGRFTICIDMLCLENIASYVLSLVFYFIRKILMKCNIPESVLTVVWLVLLLPCAWLSFCYFAYLTVEVTISLVVPLSIGYWLERMEKISSNAVLVITGILILIFSQLIWRLWSDKIYNKLINVFSFKHLSLN